MRLFLLHIFFLQFKKYTRIASALSVYADSQTAILAFSEWGHSRTEEERIKSRKQNNMAEVEPTESAVPSSMKGFTVGLIGMGDMGRMYAIRLGEAGWR